MISGYFYREENAVKQIKKIAILLIEANIIYFLWELLYRRISGTHSNINIKTIIDFIVFNESPFSGHLWYLGAILYTLLAVYGINKIGHRRILYYITPALLIGDLILGKYSLLVFGIEFSSIYIRNWIFVGIPFFSIGMLMREKDLRIGVWGIPAFTITTFIERFLLVSHGINAARDQYISTTFLAIAVFSFALDFKGNISEKIAMAGRKYSTWIYIIHPIIIACFGYVVKRIGLQTVWGYIGPIIVFIASLIFVAIMTELKNSFQKKHIS